MANKRYSNIEEFEKAAKTPRIDKVSRQDETTVCGFSKYMEGVHQIAQTEDTITTLQESMLKITGNIYLHPMITSKMGALKVYICGSLNEIRLMNSFSSELENFFSNYSVILDKKDLHLKAFVNKEDDKEPIPETQDDEILMPMPKVLANIIWTSHGSDPDKEYTAFSKLNGKPYCEAINDHVIKGIFEADKKHIRESDIIINLGPSGKSAIAEMAYAAGLSDTANLLKSKKFVFFIKGLENHHDYEGIDCMVHFADKVFCNKDEFFRDILRQLCLTYSASENAFVIPDTSTSDFLKLFP